MVTWCQPWLLSSKEGYGAITYTVTRQTLMKGHVEHGRRPGPSTVLSGEDEGILVTYHDCAYMAQRG